MKPISTKADLCSARNIAVEADHESTKPIGAAGAPPGKNWHIFEEILQWMNTCQHLRNTGQYLSSATLQQSTV
eukprot:10643230-Karenia_brevis.AAC.1